MLNVVKHLKIIWDSSPPQAPVQNDCTQTSLIILNVFLKMFETQDDISRHAECSEASQNNMGFFASASFGSE